MKAERKKTRKTTDAIAILDRMMGKDPDFRRQAEQARVNAVVAQRIYNARTKAG
jgi:hypothetical protein